MAVTRAELRGDDDAIRDLLGRTGPFARLATAVSADIVTETTMLLNNGAGPAGVRVRTGRLKTSLEERLTVSGRRITIRVGTRVEYAPLVHNGRGPVVARNARALRIVLPGGQTIYRKSVGPAAPRPFLREGARRALAKRGIQLR